MITQQEKSLLKALVSSPQWKVVNQLAIDLCLKIKDNSPVRNSEWDTIKETLKQEGKIEGIKQFLQEIFQSVE